MDLEANPAGRFLFPERPSIHPRSFSLFFSLSFFPAAPFLVGPFLFVLDDAVIFSSPTCFLEANPAGRFLFPERPSIHPRSFFLSPFLFFPPPLSCGTVSFRLGRCRYFQLPNALFLSPWIASFPPGRRSLHYVQVPVALWLLVRPCPPCSIALFTSGSFIICMVLSRSYR